jgi:hypothetical protein
MDSSIYVCPCILHQVTDTFYMISKNTDVTRINKLFHKIKCNIQKNDHMMATYN